MKEYPYAFIRKKIVKSKDATVPVQCKALQYGLGCFSGIRGFWNKKSNLILLSKFIAKKHNFKKLDDWYKLNNEILINDFYIFFNCCCCILLHNGLSLEGLKK